jgi:hypothetical protein
MFDNCVSDNLFNLQGNSTTQRCVMLNINGLCQFPLWRSAVLSKISWLQVANFVVCHSFGVILGIYQTVGFDNVVTMTMNVYKLNQCLWLALRDLIYKTISAVYCSFCFLSHYRAPERAPDVLVLMESGARPSAPDKIHFTGQSHQLYRPSNTTNPPIRALCLSFVPLPSILLVFPPPARVRLWDTEREIEEAASLARLHGKWALGWSKEEDGDRYLLALAISSMYSRRCRRLHSQSSPQYEYDMTLPRIALDVELARAGSGCGERDACAIARTPS